MRTGKETDKMGKERHRREGIRDKTGKMIVI